jgi:hypothetical protein
MELCAQFFHPYLNCNINRNPILKLNWCIFPFPPSRLEAQGGAHIRVGRTDRGGHPEHGATATFWHPVPGHSSCAEGCQRHLAPQGDWQTFLKGINHFHRSIHARCWVSVPKLGFRSNIVTLRHRIISEQPVTVHLCEQFAVATEPNNGLCPQPVKSNSRLHVFSRTSNLCKSQNVHLSKIYFNQYNVFRITVHVIFNNFMTW